MENFLILVLTHHSMITSLHKPWIRCALKLLTPVLLIAASGCKQTKDDTWYCYDRKGKPVEGVLIICRYSLANSGRAAINHRFSNATGMILINLDDDTPDGLIRGYSCIYSANLKSGDIGLGERWHEGQPVPAMPVYFDEWNKKIYLKSGIDDPVIWHSALTSLISSYSELIGNTNGGAKLNAELSSLVSQERALFLERYGEQVVPLEYLKTGWIFRVHYLNIDKSRSDGLKFKDITLPLPKL